MAPRLYLETTIPSYLVARRSRDLRLASDQEATQRWWDEHRADYELFISDLVLEETAGGEAAMAAERHKLLEGLPQLAVTADVHAVAERILDRGIIPAQAAPDAEHIALAAVHAMNFLLTWNCRHIANIFNRRRLESVCAEFGLNCPIICTPQALLVS